MMVSAFATMCVMCLMCTMCLQSRRDACPVSLRIPLGLKPRTREIRKFF